MNRPRIKTRRVALVASSLVYSDPLLGFVLPGRVLSAFLPQRYVGRLYARTRVHVPACVPASTPAPVRVVSLGPLSGNS